MHLENSSLGIVNGQILIISDRVIVFVNKRFLFCTVAGIMLLEDFKIAFIMRSFYNIFQELNNI